VSVTIRTATEADAHDLAPIMRSEDAAEVFASDGWTPLEALLESMRKSNDSWAVLVDGRIAAIFGVVSTDILGGVGTAWMLTGPAVEAHPVSFLRTCRRGIAQMLERWPVLTNWVDARYVRSLRWAKWLGFAIGPARPVGRLGELFHPIELRSV
jgi:hypothetical protein